MKEVLIISNYFPPETGAASNRISHLAEALAERSYKVSVIAPLPNYPYGKIFDDYRGAFKHRSVVRGITLTRLWIYASNSRSVFKRLLAMLSFSFSLSLYFLFNRSPKTIIIQSPPLLVAFTAIFWLRSNKRKIILNVSDLWPLAGKELGVLKEGVQYNILKRIERFNYRNARVIWGQSKEILDHCGEHADTDQLFLYRNFPKINVKLKLDPPEGHTLKIVYAGLLGVAQGIVKLCSELNYSGVEFHIYGAGAEQQELEHLLKSNPEWPVYYHGEIERAKLHEVLTGYHLVIIPLLNRIYGSVPSKIFEYAKLGLPMIYFGGGEGEEIIKTYDLGWVVEAANYDHLNSTISSIKAQDLTREQRVRIRETAVKEFDFERQFDRLSDSV